MSGDEHFCIRCHHRWQGQQWPTEYCGDCHRECQALKAKLQEAEKALQEVQAERDAYASKLHKLQASHGDLENRSPCACKHPAPLAPGAVCRKCHKYTVVMIDEPPASRGEVVKALDEDTGLRVMLDRGLIQIRDDEGGTVLLNPREAGQVIDAMVRLVSLTR